MAPGRDPAIPAAEGGTTRAPRPQGGRSIGKNHRNLHVRKAHPAKNGEFASQKENKIDWGGGLKYNGINIFITLPK